MYRFNLQVLLDYRKRIEEGFQIELSLIQKKLEDARQALLSSQQEKTRYEEELAEKESREVNLPESILYRDYLRGIRKKIQEQRAMRRLKRGLLVTHLNELALTGV